MEFKSEEDFNDCLSSGKAIEELFKESESIIIGGETFTIEDVGKLQVLQSQSATSSNVVSHGLIALKGALLGIAQNDDFAKKSVEAKISLIGECFRNIFTSNNKEIAKGFDEAFRNPKLLANGINSSETPDAISISIKVLEEIRKNLVRKDMCEIIDAILSYFNK